MVNVRGRISIRVGVRCWGQRARAEVRGGAHTERDGSWSWVRGIGLG